MGIIETRLVNKAAFQAVGLQILWEPEQVKPSENQISKLWERLYYDERFRGNDNPESIYEVWFPVKAKQG
jgi:predicted transcriptional regulator YdeE